LDWKSYCLNTMQWWHRQPKICAMQVWQSKSFWNAWGSEKWYTIKTNTWHWVMDLENSRIRKLTPTECERLQTVPDNYTSCVSNSQRYKMLWNGWTVDVIAYIFKDLLPK
jgi:site-specific DNA-cytosine methylase